MSYPWWHDLNFLDAGEFYQHMLKGSKTEEEEKQNKRFLILNDLWYLLVYTCRLDFMISNDHVTQWLYDRCREVEHEPDEHLDLWAREHYKDLDNRIPVLTANRGWVSHGSLGVGDRVYSPEGDDVAVLAVTEQYTDSKCYEITFSDGHTLIAGAGHLWKVRQKHRLREANGRKTFFSESVVTTQEIAENPEKRWDVGASSPIKGKTDLPADSVDPYTLGVWLGDGHSSCGRITQTDKEIWGYIEEAGYRLSRTENDITRNVYGLMPALRYLGVLNDKHIPVLYKESDTNSRLWLLRGLMDSDGHCNTRGTATFTNQNAALAQDVYELASGLGMRPRLRVYKPRNAPKFYQVGFQAKLSRNPFRLNRKAIRAKPDSHYDGCRTVQSIREISSVPTKCIQVEGGMYVVGEAFIPTHNSTIITFGKTIQDILTDPEQTFGIFSYSKENATKFTKQIKEQLEGNQDLKYLFPEVLYDRPESQSPEWTDSSFIVKRDGRPKEPTVMACGLLKGMPTGMHFGKRVYDDIITEDMVGTPDMIKKTTARYRNSTNLGRLGGTQRLIGTRYHLFDTYRDLMKDGVVKVRLHPATSDGSDDVTKSVFMPVSALRKKRQEQGPYIFGCFAAGTPVLLGDWTEAPIESLDVGDTVVGYEFGTGKRSRLVRSRVLAKQVRPMSIFEYEFASGRKLVATEDHKFWSGRPDRGYAPLSVSKRRGHLTAACEVYNPDECAITDAPEWAVGYLAGFFDGEGCVSGNAVHFSQHYGINPQICDTLERALQACGFEYSVYEREAREGHRDYYLTGGRKQKMRFARLMSGYGKHRRVVDLIYENGTRDIGKGSRDRLVAMRPLGTADVYNIHTETGNYVAGGYAVKNCQMLQDPKADNQMGFLPEWLQYWDAKNLANLNFLIICDPASGRRASEGKNDYTSFWVVGVGGDNNYYVCDIVRARLNLGGRCDVLFALVRKFRKHGEVRVGYEEYGMQADIEHFKYVQQQQNYRFKIHPLGGIANKNARINRLHPLFEQGRIWLPERCLKKVTEGTRVQTVDMVKIFVEEEYEAYPVLDHDDMLDSLSRIEDEDMKKLPAPEEKDTGWNAIRELELRQMENEPVV